MITALSLALAGCAGDAGGAGAGASPPIAMVLATKASDAAAATRSKPGLRPARPARAASGHPAVIGGLPRLGTTAPAPARSRRAPGPSALDASEAGRLAAPACATLRAAVGGHLPDVVARRGEGRGLAVVTQAAAASLLGLPIVVPAAARKEHAHLAASHAALTGALDQTRDAAANTAAATTRARVRAYAVALRIDACG